jgi:hypothetical protein
MCVEIVAIEVPQQSTSFELRVNNKNAAVAMQLGPDNITEPKRGRARILSATQHEAINAL